MWFRLYPVPGEPLEKSVLHVEQVPATVRTYGAIYPVVAKAIVQKVPEWRRTGITAGQLLQLEDAKGRKLVIIDEDGDELPRNSMRPMEYERSLFPSGEAFGVVLPSTSSISSLLGDAKGLRPARASSFILLKSLNEKARPLVSLEAPLDWTVSQLYIAVA
jgi:hypothetical protein